jgi:hypothetical protein
VTTPLGTPSLLPHAVCLNSLSVVSWLSANAVVHHMKHSRPSTTLHWLVALENAMRVFMCNVATFVRFTHYFNRIAAYVESLERVSTALPRRVMLKRQRTTRISRKTFLTKIEGELYRNESAVDISTATLTHRSTYFLENIHAWIQNKSPSICHSRST